MRTKGGMCGGQTQSGGMSVRRCGSGYKYNGCGHMGVRGCGGRQMGEGGRGPKQNGCGRARWAPRPPQSSASASLPCCTRTHARTRKRVRTSHSPSHTLSGYSIASPLTLPHHYPDCPPHPVRGYSIAAASLGIKHRLVKNFQVRIARGWGPRWRGGVEGVPGEVVRSGRFCSWHASAPVPTTLTQV
jgi:hypothetical protein